MDLGHLSRGDLESLFKAKYIELQMWWRNAIDYNDFDDVPKFSDEELRTGIRTTVRQLRFEKWFLRPIQIAATVVVPLAILYALVRFVKWAWTG